MKKIKLTLTMLLCSLFVIGCSSVGTLMKEVDYGCADIDGYFTDTRGRAIKVPDGVEVTDELLHTICN